MSCSKFTTFKVSNALGTMTYRLRIVINIVYDKNEIIEYFLDTNQWLEPEKSTFIGRFVSVFEPLIAVENRLA